MEQWKQTIRPLTRLGVKKIVLSEDSYERFMNDVNKSFLDLDSFDRPRLMMPTDRVQLYGIKIEKEDELL